MEDELGGKSITKFVGRRPSTYSYSMTVDEDDSSKDKKAKDTKKCHKTKA